MSFIICTLHLIGGTVKWEEHVACMVEYKNAYKMFVEKLKEETTSESVCRWEDNIKSSLTEVV
jgi:hypothetical protein